VGAAYRRRAAASETDTCLDLACDCGNTMLDADYSAERPKPSLNPDARRRRLRAVRSWPVSFVR